MGVLGLPVDKVHHVLLHQFEQDLSDMHHRILVYDPRQFLLAVLLGLTSAVPEVLVAIDQLGVELELLLELLFLLFYFLRTIPIKSVPFPVNYGYLLNIQHVPTRLEHGLYVEELVNHLDLRHPVLRLEFDAGVVGVHKRPLSFL